MKILFTFLICLSLTGCSGKRQDYSPHITRIEPTVYVGKLSKEDIKRIYSSKSSHNSYSINTIPRPNVPISYNKSLDLNENISCHGGRKNRIRDGNNIDMFLGKFNRTRNGAIMAGCFSFVVPDGHIGILTIKPLRNSHIDPNLHVGYMNNGKLKYLREENRGKDILILPLFFTNGDTEYSGVLYNAANRDGNATFHFHTVNIFSSAFIGGLQGAIQEGITEYLSGFLGVNVNKSTRYTHDIGRAITLAFSQLSGDSINKTKIKMGLNEAAIQLQKQGVNPYYIQSSIGAATKIHNDIYKHYY